METSSTATTSTKVAAATGAILLPLALAQFIASYAGSNMNVAISSIASDLGTTVSGVQVTITLFTLTMAALMIPGSKLTDIWGRKRCFQLGLIIYGAGALIATFAQGLGLLTIGYSILEGVGSALMIPPIYILVTVSFPELHERAKSFGIVSAAAGAGAAAGPLIGGLVTSAFSWRASFILQVLVVVGIIFLSRKIVDPGVTGQKPKLDIFGAVLSGLGLLCIVLGIQLSGTYGWFTAKVPFSLFGRVIIPEGGISPVWVFVGIGSLLIAWFFFHIRSMERAGKEPLIATHLFRNKISNLGLVTQNIQWLTLQGSFFVVSVFLQTVRGFSSIQTGLILTASTVGLLITSFRAQRMSKRFSQAFLIRTGFILTILGTVTLLLLGNATSEVWKFLPGLFLMGAGIGIMLTSSVNVVQGAFPEQDQGDISGLSRAISNLGSSMGVAIAGSVLVGAVAKGNTAFAWALLVLLGFGVIGLIAALRLPSSSVEHSTNQS